VPDGLAARHPYAVLAQALRQGHHWALGRAVLSGLRQLVLVRPHGRLLVLHVLHYPSRVRTAPAWEGPADEPAASAEELGLAQQLINAASGPPDWARWRDTTAEDWAALIAAKVAGRALVTAADGPVANLGLLDALKQSVAAAQGEPATPPRTCQPPHSRRRKPA
jgi:DNA end-binding protein Ku